MKKYLLLILIIYSQFSFSQGLFESASSESETEDKAKYELNGYIRGVYFVGESLTHNDELSTQAAYGESSLKFKLDKAEFGNAFAEIRFNSGYAYEEKFSQIDIREAYVNYYTGKFNFSFGKKIIVWGRADGYNPTNVLSLQNMIARSANEDDKRFGNWLLSGSYSYNIFKFEAIIVPIYESALIPFGLIEKKFGAPFGDENYPDFRIKNSSIALRANINAPKIDGSISFFNGYSPKPGIDATKTINGVIFNPRAYHINLLGADFQTTINKYGIRGEFAYTATTQDKSIPYVPNNDFQYVFGIDRNWNNFSALLQYSGRYVFDFKELPQAIDSNMMFMIELEKRNRLFNGQQYELSHTTIARISYKFLHETLDANILGMYNITTKEFMIRPKISYSITDAMEIAAGMEYYHGPEETLFGLLSGIVNAGFMELKISF